MRWRCWRACRHRISDNTTRIAPGSKTDCARYTDPASIWEALKARHVRLIRMTWLIKLAKKGGILGRRQDLPPEAFIDVEELMLIYDKSGKGGPDHVLPIVAISFCWLSAQHPDPDGTLLCTIAERLESEQAKFSASCQTFNGFNDIGVFWDWASVWQKNPAVFDATQTPEALPEVERLAFKADLKAKRRFFGGYAYEMSRTPEQIASFRIALETTMGKQQDRFNPSHALLHC